MTTKPMTVEELIKAVSALPPGTFLCGSDPEFMGVLSGVGPWMTADEWHDSLPAGTPFVTLDFNCLIPHVRGTGALAEKVPPEPPPLVQQVCRYCAYEEACRSPMACPRCSWQPMMKPKTALEKTDAARQQAVPPARPGQTKTGRRG